MYNFYHIFLYVAQNGKNIPTNQIEVRTRVRKAIPHLSSIIRDEVCSNHSNIICAYGTHLSITIYGRYASRIFTELVSHTNTYKHILRSTHIRTYPYILIFFRTKINNRFFFGKKNNKHKKAVRWLLFNRTIPHRKNKN